jgi:hypothetical protein
VEEVIISFKVGRIEKGGAQASLFLFPVLSGLSVHLAQPTLDGQQDRRNFLVPEQVVFGSFFEVQNFLDSNLVAPLCFPNFQSPPYWKATDSISPKPDPNPSGRDIAGHVQQVKGGILRKWWVDFRSFFSHSGLRAAACARSIIFGIRSWVT